MSMVRRTSMALYSGSTDMLSHRVRIVLAEKAMNVDIIPVDLSHPPQEFVDINAYQDLPTLIDRGLVLNQSRIIMEYLDERFPHPPLLPVYPISRAKSRLMIYRIETDWYRLLDKIVAGENLDENRHELCMQLLKLVDIFKKSEYFVSDEFSLVDCTMAPLLWRLPYYDVELPPRADPILEYAERIFQRDSFRASLTDQEIEMREEIYDF